MKHLLFVLLIVPFSLFAQTSPIAEPTNTTFCEVSRDPSAFNHRVVRMTAFVTHGFEDFLLAEPDCPTQGFSIWLMYGGKVESNTMYCCPGEAASRTRSEPLKVEGEQISLVDDQRFHQFAGLLRKEPDTTVRATVVGRFFSGEKVSVGGSTFWRGFGHVGCCSLLVIERVESFEPHIRTDLDYTAEAGWYEDEGCKWGTEQDRRHVAVGNLNGEAQKGIAEQESADDGRSWAFSDPRRVAVESLKPLYPGQVPVLTSAKRTPAREVFHWKNGKGSIVTVVVTRPYWLTFYAASDSVAWVATMIKEVGCK